MSLTFRGIRNANVRDRDTLLRLRLPRAQAAKLWHLLGDQLTPTTKNIEHHD